MTDLKPCPFCGGKPDYWYDAELVPVGVTCKCGASVRFMRMKAMGSKETFGDVQKRIAERWNRRNGK